MKKNDFIDEWIEKAEGDYETVLDLNSKRKKRQQYIIAFHCQQCIEKYLKALLTLYEINFPKHHDLEELMVLLIKKDPLIESFRSKFKELTPFAVGFRYPGEDVSSEEVKSSVQTVKKLRKILRKKLGLKV